MDLNGAASGLGDAGGRIAGLAGDTDDRWTLHAADRALLGNKAGATRLGFAVLLKLFAAEGRFPRRPEDVLVAAVEAVAGQARDRFRSQHLEPLAPERLERLVRSVLRRHPGDDLHPAHP